MSITHGQRSKPGMPEDYWQKTVDMQDAEIKRLRAVLTEAVSWLDGDRCEQWMQDAVRLVGSHDG